MATGFDESQSEVDKGPEAVKCVMIGLKLTGRGAVWRLEGEARRGRLLVHTKNPNNGACMRRVSRNMLRVIDDERPGGR